MFNLRGVMGAAVMALAVSGGQLVVDNRNTINALHALELKYGKRRDTHNGGAIFYKRRRWRHGKFKR